jgi:hypothetical protein
METMFIVYVVEGTTSSIILYMETLIQSKYRRFIAQKTEVYSTSIPIKRDTIEL